MTRFWPVSIMLNSAALKPEQKLELTSYGTAALSEQTFRICMYIASLAQGMDITMLSTEGVPLRRVYLKHPPLENWMRLERAVFIDTGCGFAFNVDALH